MNFKRCKGVVAKARQIILNVYFFSTAREDFERQAGETPFSAVKKTWDDTGVSKSTVMNIRKEAVAGELQSPGTVSCHRAEQKTSDSLQARAFRRMVHSMCLQVRHSFTIVKTVYAWVRM